MRQACWVIQSKGQKFYVSEQNWTMQKWANKYMVGNHGLNMTKIYNMSKASAGTPDAYVPLWGNLVVSDIPFVYDVSTLHFN